MIIFFRCELFGWRCTREHYSDVIICLQFSCVCASVLPMCEIFRNVFVVCRLKRGSIMEIYLTVWWTEIVFFLQVDFSSKKIIVLVYILFGQILLLPNIKLVSGEINHKWKASCENSQYGKIFNFLALRLELDYWFYFLRKICCRIAIELFDSVRLLYRNIT